MININNRFNEELQRQIDGTLPKGHIYQFGMPGEILLGAGIKNLPIELAASILITKANVNYRNNHPFNLADIKDLPNAINEPIAIFNSTKPDGKKIILTELKDKNGYNPHHRANKVEINSIRSIYPKDRTNDIINMLKNDKLTAWKNEEKATRFVSTQSTNLIAGGNKGGSTLNIVNNFEKNKV